MQQMNPVNRINFYRWVGAMVLVRLAVGLFLCLSLVPLSIDDYFRIFHALWWWDHPSFTSSYVWLPGHQYVYGVLVGLSGDAVLAPRLLTLALHLASGILFIKSIRSSDKARLIVLAVFYFSPLSLVLGTFPLTESLAMFYLAMHLFALSRFHDTHRIVWLLYSSAALLLVCTVRYELWILLAAYPFLARRSRATDAGPLLQWSVVFLPVIFPVVWILHGLANPDGCFAFLRGTTEDHLGPGSVSDVATSYWGIISIAQILAVLLFSFFKHQQRVRVFSRAPSLYMIVLLAELIAVMLLNTLPSQFAERVLYGPVLLSAILAGELLSTANKPLVAGVLCLAGVSCICSATVAIVHPQTMDLANYDAAMFVDSRYRNGQLGDDDHVIVSKQLPDSTAILIFGNKLDNIHIDGMRKGCGPLFLTEYAPICALPPWANEVQLVVTWKTGNEEAYMKTLGWSQEMETDNWTIWRRPANTTFPIKDKEMHPMEKAFEEWKSIRMPKEAPND